MAEARAAEAEAALTVQLVQQVKAQAQAEVEEAKATLVAQAQAVAGLEAAGQTDQAQMVASMTLTPGAGVDFTALAQVLALAALVYLFSSILSWGQNYLMAGVTLCAPPPDLGRNFQDRDGRPFRRGIA